MTQYFLPMQFMYTAIVLHQRAIYSAALTVTPRAKIFLMLSFCMLIFKFTDRKGPYNTFTGDGRFCLANIKRTKCQRIYRFIRHNLLYLSISTSYKVCPLTFISPTAGTNKHIGGTAAEHTFPSTACCRTYFANLHIFGSIKRRENSCTTYGTLQRFHARAAAAAGTCCIYTGQCHWVLQKRSKNSSGCIFNILDILETSEFVSFFPPPRNFRYNVLLFTPSVCATASRVVFCSAILRFNSSEQFIFFYFLSGNFYLLY